MKKPLIAIIFALLFLQSSSFAITKRYNINRLKNTKDIQYPHSNEEMLADLGWDILYSLFSNVPGAIIGTGNGVKNFLKATEKYQENL